MQTIPAPRRTTHTTQRTMSVSRFPDDLRLALLQSDHSTTVNAEERVQKLRAAVILVGVPEALRG